MIRLYQRLTARCKTINQINRIHIALENWMTPTQWEELYDGIKKLDEFQFLNIQPQTSPKSVYDIAYAQYDWFYRMSRLYEAVKYNRVAEPYLKVNRSRHWSFYRNPIDYNKKTLVVCFTGLAQRMMMPLPIFLQNFDANAVDILMILYPKGVGFREGMVGFSESFEETLEALEMLACSYPYARKVALGVSGGGSPAVLCALKAGWDAAMSFSGAHPYDERWHKSLKCSLAHLIEKYKLRQTKKMPIYLVFGWDSIADKAAAEAFGKLLPAQLIQINPNNQPVGHLSILPIVKSGKLRQFFNDTLLAI